MIQRSLLATIIILIVLGQVLLFITPSLGLYINMLLVLVLIILAIIDKPDIYAQDVMVLSAIIPAISILSISFGLKDLFLSEYIIIIIMIFLSFFYLWDFKLPDHPLRIDNIKNSIIIIPFVLIIEAGFLFYKHTEHVQIFSPFYISVLFIFLLSVGESLYFFSLIQNTVADMSDNLTSIIYTDILFTLFQSNNSLYIITLYILFGLLLTYIYKHSKNIYLISFIIFSYQMTFFLLSGKILLLNLH